MGAPRKFTGQCPKHYPRRRYDCRHCVQYGRHTGEMLPLIEKHRVFVEPPMRIVGSPPQPVYRELHWPAPDFSFGDRISLET